jgi:hypothetical protein
VALVKPYKKRRLKVLARERRDLLARLDETALIMAHHFWSRDFCLLITTDIVKWLSS